MNKIIYLFIIFFLSSNHLYSEENKMILKLKNGDVEIELYPDIAPNHVKRFKTLANEGKYDSVPYTCIDRGWVV